MSFMQTLGEAFSGLRQRMFFGTQPYEAQRYDSREMAGWTPSLTSGTDENLDARDAVTRRARDLVRNHPIISGATDRRAESVVGSNIRLETQPAFESMGQSPDWADEWSQNTEQHFELWARDPRKLCDAQMHLQFGGMVELAYRHWWNDGEAAAVIKMLPPVGPRVLAQWETCLEVVDPDRVSNPNGLPDHHKLSNGRTLIGGIEYDRNGAPLAAHVRVAHPSSNNGGTLDSFRWTRVPFYGPTGRPIFVHAFKRNRADQRRGISRFVSAIKRIKMFDRFDDAELEAALLNAIMAVSIESAAPTAEVAAAMAPTSGKQETQLPEHFRYRMDHPVRMQGVRVFHGLPGEKMEFKRSEHPSQNYPEFQATGLRSMAASLGLSYAQISQNWADINYSSARAMLNEIWRGLLHDRWLFTQGFCTPIYLAWLEEAVAKGIIQVPGRKTNFYKYRNALSLCEWIGPGRGSVDPLKEGQADDFRLNQGATDLTTMSNESGKDYRKTLRNQAREKKYREQMGLEPYMPLKAGAGHTSAPEAYPEGNAQVDPVESEGQSA
ncbi:phage portal protein [Altererythrobacter indicus]|uniref:Phage portal protein n=1 Tax=Altericroceibacterium indicum TaxID=374177 RepID=A0A845A701_9SPHN|nr:phage portal protein [Altericroceibacterium indicum]MXP24821.1 phage portal protein [Altericroceibacterium indicum]